MHFSNTLESLIPAFEPRHGGNSRFPIVGTFVLGVFLALTPAEADAYAPKDGAATRHRVAASAGFGLVINAAGIDGRYENSKVGPSGHVAYAFRPFRGLEIGADVGYWQSAVRDTSFHTFLPSASLRPFISLGQGSVFEVGATARFGLFFMHLPEAFDPPASPRPESETWSGLAVAGGPDVRVWFDEHWALQFGIEFAYGRGESSIDPQTQALYLSKGGNFAAAGPWVGCAAGF